MEDKDKIVERRVGYIYLEKDISRMSVQVDKIYKLLYENGLVAQIKSHDVYIAHQKQIGYIALKTILVFIILMTLGVIAFKIGIPKW